MLAQGANEIFGQYFPLINIAAKVAAMTGFLYGLGFWLDGLLIIRIRNTVGFAENLPASDVTLEQSVRAEINGIH